jgi:hypothetical protein
MADQGQESNQSIFTESGDQHTQTNKSQSNETNNNSTTSEAMGQTFAELVGEGKRYKSPEELARGKKEADAFIEQLKRENAEMREDLTKAKSLDEVLDSIKGESKKEGDNQGPQFDEETLVKLVDSRLSAKEQENQRQANSKVVEQAMIKRFGEFDKANAYINAKAQELGMSVREMKTLADNNPKAFFRLVGIETQSHEGHKGQPDSGSANSEAIRTQNEQSLYTEGTWEYYQNLRKSNPKKYYSPEVQNEMFKQRSKLGDAFYKK